MTLNTRSVFVSFHRIRRLITIDSASFVCSRILPPFVASPLFSFRGQESDRPHYIPPAVPPRPRPLIYIFFFFPLIPLPPPCCSRIDTTPTTPGTFRFNPRAFHPPVHFSIPRNEPLMPPSTPPTPNHPPVSAHVLSLPCLTGTPKLILRFFFSLTLGGVPLSPFFFRLVLAFRGMKVVVWHAFFLFYCRY